MVTPRVKMVAIKDFYWEKAADGKWRNRWCPMGEGMVDWERVFAGFAAAKFPDATFAASRLNAMLPLRSAASTTAYTN